jgi:hypothetical protein
MKKHEVRLGAVYEAKVSGKPARVRLDTVAEYGGWVGTNLDTGKAVRIHTAGRLRKEVAPPMSVADLHRQWQRLKESNPDTVLLFLVDNRYEAYGEDATVCSEVLGLTVSTWTNCLAPGHYAKTSVAEIPTNTLEADVGKLVAAGHRVAVCERVRPGEVAGKPVEHVVG